MCIQYGVPEKVQDGYEEIIDRLLICLGINQGQRELFWTLTDPDQNFLGSSEIFTIFSCLEKKDV